HWAHLDSARGDGPLGSEAIQRLYDRTAGPTLYLRTVLSDHEGLERLGRETAGLPASLEAAIGDQLAALPAQTRSLVEMLATVNGRVPLALLGEAASVAEPTAAIEPAGRAGGGGVSADGPTPPPGGPPPPQRDCHSTGLHA